MSNVLTFNKNVDNTYFIADNNDEKLAVIGAALLDNHVREKLKQLLGDLAVLKDQYHALSRPSDKTQFHLLKTHDNFIIFRMTEAHPLEQNSKTLDIYMAQDTFLDIIEQWEDLVETLPEQIFFERKADTYTLTDDITALG